MSRKWLVMGVVFVVQVHCCHRGHVNTLLRVRASVIHLSHMDGDIHALRKLRHIFEYSATGLRDAHAPFM